MNRRHGPLTAFTLMALPLAGLALTADAGAASGGNAGTDDGKGDGAKPDDQGDGKDGKPKDDDKPEPKPDAAGKFDEAYVKQLRDEAAQRRTNERALQKQIDEAKTAQQATLDGIAKALGLKKDETVDPAELAKRVTSAEATTRDAQLELVVYRAAGPNGANPDRLLDSRAFLTSIKDIDPAAADAAAKIKTAIKDAIAGNAQLKAVQAAASSSANHSGGSGEQRTTSKPKSITEAIAADMAASG